MLNWKVWSVILLVVLVFIFVLYNNKKCKREGAKLGVPFRCKFMDSEPVTLIAEDHYFGKRDGKCYDIIDYGNNMSFREVSLSNCETEKERKERIEKNNITEVEYF